MNDLQKRSWAEISLPNLRHNYTQIRAALPEGCRFLGVVKADAYGHGALAVAGLLQELGADYLAVSCLDEALELLRGIDMHSDIGAAHHYAISDASGKSVVVEYVDNEIVVVDSPACTNHYLCEEKLNVGLYEGDRRYDFLCQQFDEAGGTMDLRQLTTSIAYVSQPPAPGDRLGTAWTMVMNLTNRSVTYYSRRHFDKPFHFALSK